MTAVALISGGATDKASTKVGTGLRARKRVQQNMSPRHWVVDCGMWDVRCRTTI